MQEDDDTSIISVMRIKSEVPQKRRRPKKIKIPHRAPSVVIPKREIIFITPDKTSCRVCPCYPKEDPYTKPKKLNPCQKSPLTLYELAAAAVNQLPYPEQFYWTEDDVAEWMAVVVGLPQYKACILDNHINGRRLILLEDPSVLPEMNIHDFEHIKMITAGVRKCYTMEFIHFMRSIGLPARKPLTPCTLFKSRTGPTWGIRQNWQRSDVLRWMQIMMPEPLHLDHWDLVWYQKPEFPKMKLARVGMPEKFDNIPRYTPSPEICNEYLVPRRFRIQTNIPEDAQMIWMEHRPGSPSRKEPEVKAEPEKQKKKVQLPKESRLIPQKVSFTGLSGKDLILARRKANKPKFLKSSKTTLIAL